MAETILGGLNQEITQQVLVALIQQLAELNNRLGFLANVRGTLADLRVTPTGTVTITGSLANQSLAGGYLMNNHIPALMNGAAYQNISIITL